MEVIFYTLVVFLVFSIYMNYRFILDLYKNKKKKTIKMNFSPIENKSNRRLLGSPRKSK